MARAGVAVKAVARIRAALNACTEPQRGAVWTVHDADTGYDSVTFTSATRAASGCRSSRSSGSARAS